MRFVLDGFNNFARVRVMTEVAGHLVINLSLGGRIFSDITMVIMTMPSAQKPRFELLL